MTPEMSAFLHRPLFLTLSVDSFNQKGKGIPPTNSEMILLIMSDARHVSPDIDECITVNFCDGV